MSSIQQFYANQNIFLTGATGFVGKLILEKLLRTCHDIKKVYILLRPKRNRTMIQRFEALFDEPCFNELKALHPNFHKKIEILSGDCASPFLGLSKEDQIMLENEVTCVIHAAANVKFEASLKTAIFTNVRSVRDLLTMAKKMRKLRCFVYVSTAFSHCPRQQIDEEFYEVGVDTEGVIAMVECYDDEVLEIVTPKLLGKWPNTYVYSKALAEQLFQNETLPYAIVRPAIVISACEEPLPGWIDNFHGLVGLVIGVSMGVVRSLRVNPKLKASLVPADYVVRSIVASAWYSSKNHKNLIYNFTGSESNSVTWGKMVDILMSFSLKYPLSSALWYYNFSLTPHWLVHKIRVFFLHTAFAHVVDSVLFGLGKNRIAVEKYKKINRLIECLTYFSLRSWDFSNKNVKQLWMAMNEEDRVNFRFNMENFDWENYCENCVIGGRIYLMKDPLETLPKAKKRIFLLAVLHYAFIVFIFYLFYKIVFWFI